MIALDPLAAYDFELPQNLIAQHAPVRRRDARLLVWPWLGPLRDESIVDLERLLRPGDLVVLNDTRVFPARLYGVKRGGTARVEVLLVSALPSGGWSGLVRPGRRLPEGTQVLLDGGEALTVGADLGQGQRELSFAPGLDVIAFAEANGHIPLPPYIDRADEPEDRDRYQTVFARESGSVAAPTAGLHLDEVLLARLQEAGVELATLTLHVGPGTFRPVDYEDLRRGHLHAERYTVPVETIQAIAACREREGRVIAVGTTACRTLESIDLSRSEAQDGHTSLFIRPGHRFQAVDVLLTNFHLPRSSLLILVAALAGERWRAAYAHAVEAGYRFYSYGDANWIEGGPRNP